MNENIEAMLGILEESKQLLGDSNYMKAIETLGKIKNHIPEKRCLYEIDIIRVTSNLKQKLDISSFKDVIIAPSVETLRIAADLEPSAFDQIVSAIELNKGAIRSLEEDAGLTRAELIKSPEFRFNKFLRMLESEPFVVNESVSCVACESNNDDNFCGGRVLMSVSTQTYATSIRPAQAPLVGQIFAHLS